MIWSIIYDLLICNNKFMMTLIIFVFEAKRLHFKSLDARFQAKVEINKVASFYVKKSFSKASI